MAQMTHLTALAQITSVLEDSFYFFALAEGRWCLAVYQPLRWGFAGTGKIAEDFIEALSLVPGAELMTAAARKKDRLPQAQEFAKKHGQHPHVLWRMYTTLQVSSK